jgi:phosphoribosyl 1,2-cyclic phosphodiesterase
MRVAVLASGSSGNAIVVESNGTAVLVDAGISGKRVTAAMDSAGLATESLSAVLVTHEHSDHIGGLGPVARRFGLPVYATSGTHEAIDGRVGTCPDRAVIEAGRRFEIGDLEVAPFSVSHDCADPVGYSITDGASRVAIATDLGVVGRSVRRHLEMADCVILEFNHDEHMLVDGTYPWPLKRRIMSNVGHLSNVTAARELMRLADGPMSTLVLAHLSQENNTPELAAESAADVLDRTGRADVAVHVASQNDPLGPIEIERTVSAGETART